MSALTDMDIGMSSQFDRRRRFEAIADEVFEPLQRYLLRRASASDAEDVLADVMLVVWRRLDDAPVEAILPWSYGIARHALANHRRGQRRHLRLVERLESQPHISTSPDPAESGPDPELSAALESLSDDDRELLRLWAWEHLEPREIAPVLGVSVNAATLKLSRARKKLGAALVRQDRFSTGHRAIEGTQESR